MSATSSREEVILKQVILFLAHFEPFERSVGLHCAGGGGFWYWWCREHLVCSIKPRCWEGSKDRA
jgi:hypothetical protein